MSMTSSRPYMIRALYEWIVDNGCTPHVLVDAYGEGVQVPQQYVNKDGQVVLNIAPTAVTDLLIGDDNIAFGARFGGVPTEIFVPCASVLSIYARENGQGVVFDQEKRPDPTPPGGGKPKGVDKPKDGDKPEGGDNKRPSLRVVK